MNYLLISETLGYVLRCGALLMLLPTLVGVYYKEWTCVKLFLVAILIGMVVSQIMIMIGKRAKGKQMRLREGFFIVAMAWILIAFLGALPFYFSGYFESFIDCLFEAISGFTTTGSTILTNIEGLPRSILFWRSFTHWIGGMGILVFMLALMPNLDASRVHLMKAESPGPAPGKLVPKLIDTSRILYTIYLMMTAVLILLLVLSGMPLYDSVIHAMGTAGTGGFSIMNASVGAYNNVAAEMIIAVFMVLFGMNFSIYYFIWKKQWSNIRENEEWKAYLILVAASVFIIMLNILPQMNSVGESFRYSFFQVASIITTTGYGTNDFNVWPSLSKAILVLLMLIGACGGSTGGGIKVSRILILCKAMLRERTQILHPNVVKGVRCDHKVLDHGTVQNVLVFFFAYLGLIIISTLVVSLDGFDLESTFTAVIATISNIGPGLGMVGPVGNFAAFSPLSKLVLSFCMLAGRLEIFPFLVLFSVNSWKRSF